MRRDARIGEVATSAHNYKEKEPKSLKSKEGKMVKTKMYTPDPPLIIVGAIQKDDLHEVVDRVISRAYKQGNGKVLDQKNLARQIVRALQHFLKKREQVNAKRRGAPKLDKITWGLLVLLDELKQSKVRLSEYRSWPTSKLNEFWEEHIWGKRSRDIPIKGESARDTQELKRKLRDRVRRELKTKHWKERLKERYEELPPSDEKKRYNELIRRINSLR